MQASTRSIALTIAVAALGYFVDVYDLVLFSVVRLQSLRDIPIAQSELLDQGVFLLNTQMAGMLTGGIVWGIIGDRRGRLSVLFGSIFLYSAANIANAFIHTVSAYAVCRFVAGVGLAGELGAGVTLVSEVMGRYARGYGTTIVATFGVLGAVLAGLVGNLTPWRSSYLIGGTLGLVLLIFRAGVAESGMFYRSKKAAASHGNFFLLFSTQKRALVYLAIILVGVPAWYAVGILITFSPEIAQAMGMPRLPQTHVAIACSYCGAALGDIASGILSQRWKNRKKTMTLFIGMAAITSAMYFVANSLLVFYAVCFALGFTTGYAAVYTAMVSEHYGTNLRVTASSSAINFVRAAVIPLSLGFQWLAALTSLTASAMIVGVAVFAAAFVAISSIQETFDRDLDFVDT